MAANRILSLPQLILSLPPVLIYLRDPVSHGQRLSFYNNILLGLSPLANLLGDQVLLAVEIFQRLSLGNSET